MSNILKKIVKPKSTTAGLPPSPDFLPLTNQRILSGLAALDDELARDPENKSPDIKIIIAGGACAVCALGNRKTTRDIDFHTPVSDHLRLITHAKLALRKRNPGFFKDFPDDWINCQMMAYIPAPMSPEGVFGDSIKNGHVLFKGKCLVAYAADYKFQFVAKTNKGLKNSESGTMALGEALENCHLNDAIHFLNKILEKDRIFLTDAATVRTWPGGSVISDNELKTINALYAHRFGTSAILI